MCAAAISFARIRRLYFGAADPKGGAVESGVRFFAQPTCHHAPEVYGGIREARPAAQAFFAGGGDRLSPQAERASRRRPRSEPEGRG